MTVDAALRTRFALASIAAWRVTHLLAYEDGPGDAVAVLRERAGDGFAGRLLDCFACVSVWVSVPFAPAVARTRRDLPLAWLALSGAACLLERVTAPSPPTAREEGAASPAADDELLREATFV